MPPILSSKNGLARAARIGVLALVGFWVLQSLVGAQTSGDGAWPNTDFSRSLVDLDEITSGGPPRDGIPPIDSPSFDSAAEAAAWLDPREPVIVLTVHGETRAYPVQVLTWHEIVNDTIGGAPVSVTFCPLCNAAIVFDRRVNGAVLDFGTTGKLRKSDMVMYDRQTESWWQQFTGKGIVGEMAGVVLERLPASIVAFSDYAAAYPQSVVLSRRTGHRRAYGSNPYRGYDSVDDQPFLFFDPVDDRLPPMTRVLNVSVASQHKLYPFTAFKREPVINDRVDSLPVVVMSRAGTLSALDAQTIAESRTVPSATAYDRRLDGHTLDFELRDGAITDTRTGSTWNLFGKAVSGPLNGQQLASVNAGVHFAFAWLAFNPDSEIYAAR